MSGVMINDGGQLRQASCITLDIDAAFEAARSHQAAALLSAREISALRAAIDRWLETGGETTLGNLLRNISSDLPESRRIFAAPFLHVVGQEAIARMSGT